jgi:tRNA 2-selenouridine synthase
MSNPAMIESATTAALSRCDMIIDVRSPAEFAEDHIPGAVNLPVLDNDERARVGTIYVQESRFLARKIGGALVARNVARHLETELAGMDGAFMVYCWRGGQRSNSMATILAQIGWRTSILKGGYKTYRRWVQGELYGEDMKLNIVLLDGGTGCGKTGMLAQLSALGVQTIDLEALAHHRGSVFGGFRGEAQPSQKRFESQLLERLNTLDTSLPVVVEAESNKIGARILPPALWRAMVSAPCIELVAERRERAKYLVAEYQDIIRDPRALDEALTHLPVYPGRKRLQAWRELADAGRFIELAETVIEMHYDPAYQRSRRADQHPSLGSVSVTPLDTLSQQAGAEAIAKLLAGR